MSRNTLILEQIQVGELDTKQYSGENLFIKLGEIQESNAEILQKYPVDKIKKLVEAKLAKQTSENAVPVNYEFRKHLNIQRIVGIAAVLCLALVLPFFVGKNQAENHGGITLEQSILENGKERAKGSSNIFVYKKSGDSALRLKNKAKVSEGDIIQISYVASGAKYGAIISIDGNGYLTQHYPEFGTKAFELDNKGEIPLDFSYQLDDAPDFERFVFITSDNQFDISSLMDFVDNSKNISKLKDENLSKYFPEDVKIKEILLLK
ncbi:MAG: hypothetical protein J6A14_06190 [Spirochaetaceae bacterium]|nr:hypothetical protein [Spirochaetaceae bacterium]